MFVIGANSTATGYNLTRSLRFRSSASAYLSRTPSVASNRSVWTWSGWIKRGKFGTSQAVFGAGNTSGGGPGASYITGVIFNGSDQLFCYWGGNSAGTSTAVFRDPSSWYHLVVVANTTTITCYINSASVLTNAISGSGAINDTQKTTIGAFWDTAGSIPYINNDTYLTEINFIDGQALTPSSFGSTNATTGVWQPARYTGTYGTNGFYLPFTDNSALTTASNVGLGKDFSGNANYWVTNNISITAGVTYDSMTDVPTLTSATAANFAVISPLVASSGNTLSNGNLTYAGTAAGNRTVTLNGSFKQYGEITIATGSAAASAFGLATSTADLTQNLGLSSNGLYGIYDNGIGFYLVSNGTTITNIGTQTSAGVVFQLAYDAVGGKLWIGKNNVWFNSSLGTTGDPSAGTNPTLSGLAANLFMFVGTGTFSTTYNCNFGQRPFTYTAPTGFVALNTYNLPTSTIVKGNTVMDATLYTGTGASLSVTNAASFKPDLVWVKSRSAATDHAWYDSVRGTTKQLESNNTGAETTEATGLTAFGSAGFTVGALAQMNTSAATYVGWQWQAGQGSSSSNTNGTITSTVSVNASAGFSVVTYTGTGANATVGHGLGVAPSMVIARNRPSSADSWCVYHVGLTSAAYFIKLQATDAQASGASVWNSTAPTSSVFSVGSSTGSNGSTNAMVAYCWTPIAGFSAFGSYTGNGSSDGPFVYTGFRPKFVLIKRTDTTGDWWIEDTSRNTYNAADLVLFPNTSGAESGPNTYYWDFLSNGLKFRSTATGYNASGGTYIYMAYAENPFRNALAR